MAFNVFEVFVKINGDDSGLDKSLDDAKSKTQKFMHGLGTVTKVGTAVLGAAATGISAIAKQSVDAYGNFEQLKGGIETLFGSSAQKVMKDAEEAFKTAGLSMNQYMDTSIQSAGSLLKAVNNNQEKAAELMNVSIVDMADNVNKMGTNMEMVQNAYRGFSRGNFTMLDNLALGFAGTKQGMQELLDKAEKISHVKYDISSYADIIQAIHVVQEEMGISGTTAKEASETIQGSLNSFKSAWQNLITGFADPNADLGKLIENMVDTGVTALDNLFPAIERALVGIGQGVQKIVPIISERLPDLVNDLLPPLIDAATSLIDGLAEALPSILSVFSTVLPDAVVSIFKSLTNAMPKITKTILGLVTNIFYAIAKALPDLMPIVFNALIKTIEETVANASVMLDAAIKMINGFVEGLVSAIPIIIKELPKIIKTIIDSLMNSLPIIIQGLIDLVFAVLDHLPEIIEAFIEAIPDIIVMIAEGIVENFPKIIVAIVKGLGMIIVKIVEWFGKLLGIVDDGQEDVEKDTTEWFDDIGQKISDWLNQAFEDVVNFFSDIFTSIGNFFSDAWDAISTWFSDLIGNIGNWLNGIFESIGNWFSNLWNNIVKWLEGIWESIGNFFESAWEFGKNLVTGIWDGIKDTAEWLWNNITGWLKNVWQGIKDFFGIKSPSKQMAWVGEMIAKGLAGGIDKYGRIAIQSAEAMNKSISDVFDDNEYDMSASVRMNDVTSRNAFMGAQNGYLGDSDSEYEEIIIPKDSSDSGRDLTVILELDKMQLGRAVYRLNNQETQRVGVQLAGVNA